MNTIGIKELAFVGYPVTDFTKARRFYGDILGLKETITFDHEGELGWVEYDLAGQTLALAKSSDQWKPDANGGGVARSQGRR
jgi:extradiol dioxygenase family protein